MARELDIVVEAHTAQAEAALARVEHGLENVAKAATPADQKLDLIGQHAPELRQKIDAMRASLDKTEESLKKIPREADKTTQSISSLGQAVLRYAGPAAIGLAIKQTLAYADSIETLSKQTGIAPGKLQALEFSAKQFNIALDPLARSISMMSDRIGSGDKSAVSALERLGLSFKTIRGMSPDAAFLSIARAISEVEDPMDRARSATDLFGRTGLELIPLLTADIDELMQKARDLGLVMEDETTKAAADLNDQLDNMLTIGKRLLAAFFMPLLPILGPLATGFGFLAAELSKMISAILSPLAQMREFAQLLGIIQTKLPQVPRGPGATFVPGSLPGLGIPTDADLRSIYGSGSSGGGSTAGGRAPNVLPFQRTFNNSLVGSPFRGYESPALWSNSNPSFPGWYQAPLSGAMEGGLPWAQYPGAVSMNAPGAGSQGFLSRMFSGRMGGMLGQSLGMLSGLLPGMSGRGSSIGSTIGSFLGPLGSIGGGLIGGLFGKLFGPSEADKTRDRRNDFISEFGGMGALQSAAGQAGFNLSGLMNAKKIEDFDREVRKLTESMDAYAKKVAEAQAEHAQLSNELATTIQRGQELGFNFNEQGELVSVSFEKMQEAAGRLGINMEALGPAFQRQRLHQAATELINDFDLLTRGGADVGTVLFGMQDEINQLVNDSIKFGVEIPANMQPWIEELMRTNQLTDENGNLITDIAQMKFGAPVATEFEKITAQLSTLIGKLDELVTRLGEMGQAVDNVTRPRTINIDYNVAPPPDTEYNSLGGIVGRPRYMALGGWVPRGTDTVPAMLTPGEGVLRRDAVSRLLRGDWPQGGGTTFQIDNITVSGEGGPEEERRVGRALMNAIRKKRRLNAA
jgi:predicted  nucleic acid-binding Zn-ribbon protein